MLKNWFNTFKLSVSQPKQYVKLSERTFWSGYWYLFLLVLIGIFIKVIVFASGVFVAVPFVKSQLPQVKKQIQNAYPSDLVVKVENGTASTNAQEPYVITLRQLIPQISANQEMNLITIDTKGTVEQYPKYKTAVLLTKTSLVFPNRDSNSYSSGRYEVFPLSQVKESITIDQNNYDALTTVILPFVDKVPQFMYSFAVFAVLFFPLFGAFAVLNWSLFYLLLMTVVLLVISKIMKRSFSYKSLYKMSMYGLTIPLIATYLSGLLNLQIPALYNLAFLGWMICILTLNRAPVYTKNNAKSKTVPSRKTLSSRSRRS